MKKKILIIPIWYPTEGNPFAGIFFKEQAEMMLESYDVRILKFQQRPCLSIVYFIKRLLGKTIELTQDNFADTIDVKEAKVFFPLELLVFDLMTGMYTKMTKRVDGVGNYHSKSYKRLYEKQIMRIYKKLNYDFDLVYGISAQGIAFQSYLMSQYAEKPLILGEHGPFPNPGTVIADTDKLAFENADCFLAISNDKIRQILLQNIHLKNIRYVGNLVDEDKFQLKPTEHEYPTFLIVAAYSFYKNYDMFIETMNLLFEKTTKKFRVIIAGYAANKGYSKNEEILEQKINSSKFAGCVELIKSIPREKMSDLYNRSDAFVMTSIQEGQPVSAIEAACCGLPIFTTRCGGVEDYVSEQIGRVVAITDAEKLSEYLRQFLEGEIVFDAKEIRRTVVEKFGKETFKKNMNQCFDSVIDQEK